MIGKGEDLSELPGIGDDLAGKIEEIVNTGRFNLLAEVEARTPSTLAALTALPGLGPKRIHALHEKLGIRTLKQLAAAAKAHRVRELAGFSAKLETNILAEIEKGRNRAQRWKISTAADFAEPLRGWMMRCPGVSQVVVAGSYRRCKDTVGDLDLLAASAKGKAAVDHFTGYDEIAEVMARGPTRATILLKAGIQVDLRVVPEESFGAALHYFTGSKAHNIHIRRLGQEKGLKINEYGVFRGRARIGGATEQDVFAAVGLPYIEPELREDRGEIEAAAAGLLPKLVTLEDIRGDLHLHTKASDGKNTIREMAMAAIARGYDYIAISDHTAHATVAHGLDADRLSRQLDEIDRANDEIGGIRILKSSEVDILADGSLDLPDRVLKRLDLAVCAIHYKFDLDAEAQTERVLRAMDNRYCTILAHPTGRLLGEREGYAVDLERVMQGARERGCFIELNAHPARLDLDDVHCRLARDMGLVVAIGSDAHSATGLDVMRYGIGQARRGWLEAKDILNTRPWKQLRLMLSR
jgi:DNA polymerase (family 10)